MIGATLTEARASCGVRFVTKDVAPIVAQLRAEGASLRQIAERLNDKGVPAPKGGKWSAVQVIRVQAHMRLTGPRRMS
jgi:Recombinase